MHNEIMAFSIVVSSDYVGPISVLLTLINEALVPRPMIFLMRVEV